MNYLVSLPDDHCQALSAYGFCCQPGCQLVLSLKQFVDLVLCLNELTSDSFLSDAMVVNQRDATSVEVNFKTTLRRPILPESRASGSTGEKLAYCG